MRVLWTYGSRGDVEPMVGLAVRLRVPDAGQQLREVRRRAHPRLRAAGAGRAGGAPDGARGAADKLADPRRRATGSVATVAEGCDALAAGGMMPAGAWL